jgi:GTP-binding protein Era
VAARTVADADVVLWLVDGSAPPAGEDEGIAALLRKLHAQSPLQALVLGLNKMDQPGAGAADNAPAYRALLGWLTPARGALHEVSLSGLTGRGVDALLATLRGLLPLGPRYYDEDEVTDVQVRFLVAELIREKALHLLGEEVPHSIAVDVDEFSERGGNMTYISAVLYVERETQKAIVLGKGGAMIKKIGQAARPEIEELVGTRVYLELWVKVWERWRKREEMLRRLGYAVPR